MRKYIDIVNQNLCEARLLIAQVKDAHMGDKEVRVWRNPTHRDFVALLDNIGSELRGIVDLSNALYVFDAYEAIHYQVAQALGIDIQYEVILQSHFLEGTTPGKAEIIDSDILIQIPSLARAYGPWAFEQPEANELNADDLMMAESKGKKKHKHRHKHKRRHTSFFGYVYGMPAYGVGAHSCSQPADSADAGDAGGGDAGGGDA